MYLPPYTILYNIYALQQSSSSTSWIFFQSRLAQISPKQSQILDMKNTYRSQVFWYIVHLKGSHLWLGQNFKIWPTKLLNSGFQWTLTQIFLWTTQILDMIPLNILILLIYYSLEIHVCGRPKFKIWASKLFNTILGLPFDLFI